MSKFRQARALLVTLALCAFVPGLASADPITGGISFSGLNGSAVPVDSSGSATSLAAATGVDFSPIIFVTGGTEDLAGIAPFTLATFTDFQFAPFSGPVNPLWSFTYAGANYAFILNTVSIAQQSSEFLSLRGTGTLTGTGFDDNTHGAWTFNLNSGGRNTFGWSSTTVPEPATLALLGLGMVGVGLRKARRSQPA